MRPIWTLPVALLASACPALAQDDTAVAPVGIAISGVAEMGLGAGPSSSDPTRTETDLIFDIEALVTFRAELDNGLTIGAEFDLTDILDEN